LGAAISTLTLCLGKIIYTLLTNILPESDDVEVSFVKNMLMRDVLVEMGHIRL
jgi:hypothetical protein